MRFLRVLLAFLIIPPLQGTAWAQSTTDAIISQAPQARHSKLIGHFKPKNGIERDILAAALLNVESAELYVAAKAGDAKAKARRGEITNLINAYDEKYVDMQDKGTPFGYQWRILSGQMQSGSVEYMIAPIRNLYNARQRALAAGTVTHLQQKTPEEAVAWQQYEDNVMAAYRQSEQEKRQASPQTAKKSDDGGSFLGTLFFWIFWLGLIGGGIYLYAKFKAKRHQTMD